MDNMYLTKEYHISEIHNQEEKSASTALSSVNSR